MPRPQPTRAAARLVLLVALAGCGGGGGGGWAPGQPLTLDVSTTFPAGTVVRDAYSGQSATVDASGKVTMPTSTTAGVLLLEKDGTVPAAFDWRNATVYFVMTDRFLDGDPSNNGSYGRTRDGAKEIGTWHGGDLKGLTAKLDYIQGLGATAIWITSPVEQVHGWVAGGGGGDFKHYGYHGYWALDFTRLDANLGTPADLTELVSQAHARGIRVLLDVVLNHPGYATGDDLLSYLPEVFKPGGAAAFPAWTPPTGGSYFGWNDLVDYKSTDWQRWWGTTWIRAGTNPGEFPGYQHPGTDELTKGLTSLPDFMTESATPVVMPTLFQRKAALAGAKGGTGFTSVPPGATVRSMLTGWHADWVRTYGVDGFRCDTALNVEQASFGALKTATAAALAEWKAAHPAEKLDDAPFWMTGEVWDHAVAKDAYYTEGGFDSLINFRFRRQLRDEVFAKQPTLAEAAEALEAIYAEQAAALDSNRIQALSYLSSHDTSLFFTDIAKGDAARQREAGTALLLAPGGVQIYYGDESGRPFGPTGSDGTAGTRSDMNWSTTDAAILAHWQKLGTFRKRHNAVGAGLHRRLASPGGSYAFSRTLGSGAGADAVVVVVTRGG
jgi:alpha-amylase